MKWIESVHWNSLSLEFLRGSAIVSYVIILQNFHHLIKLLITMFNKPLTDAPVSDFLQIHSPCFHSCWLIGVNWNLYCWGQGSAVLWEEHRLWVIWIPDFIMGGLLTVYSFSSSEAQLMSMIMSTFWVLEIEI
jgi:hypothetical protein